MFNANADQPEATDDKVTKLNLPETIALLIWGSPDIVRATRDNVFNKVGVYTVRDINQATPLFSRLPYFLGVI